MRWIKFPALLLLLSLIVWSVPHAQKAGKKGKAEEPLTLVEVLTGLQTEGRTPKTRTLTARNRYIAQRIGQRGVTFRLTAEFESELRLAGADEKLLQAIRECGPKPTPTPTPTPTPAALRSFVEDLGNDVKLELVLLPGGTFTMGSDDYGDEEPPHQVTLSSFFIGKYEVTQAQYRAVMDNLPNVGFPSNDRPVERVSWEDAVAFCQKLSTNSGRRYRLPTEAEWEYACRAGSSGDYSFGEDANQLGEYAWYSTNSGNQTHPVGQKKPNAFGLYDLHGNVWEWCADWYDKNYYQQSLRDNPQGPASGQSRVLRGGSWLYYGRSCRSAGRNHFAPGTRDNFLGFRVVVSARTQ